MPFALITKLKLGFPLLTESSEEESDDEIADKDSDVSICFLVHKYALYPVRTRPSVMLSLLTVSTRIIGMKMRMRKQVKKMRMLMKRMKRKKGMMKTKMKKMVRTEMWQVKRN